jgi:hypothetical protein
MSRARRFTLALWAFAPAYACHEDTSPGGAGSSSEGSGAVDTSAGSEAGTGGSTGASSEGSEGSSSSGDLPSPYSDSSTGPGAMPTLTGDEATAALGDGLLAFLQSRPSEIVAAYIAFVPPEAFEPGCPETQQFVDGEFVDVMLWATGGCTTAAGVSFSGSGRLQVTTDLVDGERTIDAFELSSEGSTMRVETADGGFFELSGYLAFENGTMAEAIDGAFSFIGDVSADPDTAGTNAILGGTLRPQGYVYLYSQPDYRALYGSGSITGDALGDAVAVSFADATVANYPCAIEPAGQFSVRDSEGYWHDLVFDAATFVDGDYDWSGECDGCGTHVAGGEVSDEAACIAPEALTALLDWEVMPW